MNWVLKDGWRLKEKWHSKPKRLARADGHQQVTGTQEQWTVMAEPEHHGEKPSASSIIVFLGDFYRLFNLFESQYTFL